MRAIYLVSGFFNGAGFASALASGSPWLAAMNLAFFGLNFFLVWPRAGLKEQS